MRRIRSWYGWLTWTQYLCGPVYEARQSAAGHGVRRKAVSACREAVLTITRRAWLGLGDDQMRGQLASPADSSTSLGGRCGSPPSPTTLTPPAVACATSSFQQRLVHGVRRLHDILPSLNVAHHVSHQLSSTPSLSRGTTAPTADTAEVGAADRSAFEEQYKRCNEVERTINRLKHSRVVAIRYDKRAHVSHGTVTAASVRLWLRR